MDINKLKKIRKKEGTSAREMAIMFKISTSYYYQIENKRVKPGKKLNNIIKEYIRNKTENYRAFAIITNFDNKKLVRLMRKKDIKVKQLANIIQCNPNTVAGWYEGKHKPRQIHFRKLLKSLKVKPQDLIKGNLTVAMTNINKYKGKSLEELELELRKKIERIKRIEKESY